MNALKLHIGERIGLVFVTRNHKSVGATQIDRNFRKAREFAQIGFPVSPHTLRATAITLILDAGLPDGQVMKATGYSSALMVRAYDKTESGDNASSKVVMV